MLMRPRKIPGGTYWLYLANELLMISCGNASTHMERIERIWPTTKETMYILITSALQFCGQTLLRMQMKGGGGWKYQKIADNISLLAP